MDDSEVGALDVLSDSEEEAAREAAMQAAWRKAKTSGRTDASPAVDSNLRLVPKHSMEVEPMAIERMEFASKTIAARRVMVNDVIARSKALLTSIRPEITDHSAAASSDSGMGGDAHQGGNKDGPESRQGFASKSTSLRDSKVRVANNGSRAGMSPPRLPLVSNASTIGELRETTATLARNGSRSLSPRSADETDGAPRKTALRKESDQSMKRGKTVRFRPPSNRSMPDHSTPEEGTEDENGKHDSAGIGDLLSVSAVDPIVNSAPAESKEEGSVTQGVGSSRLGNARGGKADNDDDYGEALLADMQSYEPRLNEERMPQDAGQGQGTIEERENPPNMASSRAVIASSSSAPPASLRFTPAEDLDVGSGVISSVDTPLVHFDSDESVDEAALEK